MHRIMVLILGLPLFAENREPTLREAGGALLIGGGTVMTAIGATNSLGYREAAFRVPFDRRTGELQLNLSELTRAFEGLQRKGRSRVHVEALYRHEGYEQFHRAVVDLEGRSANQLAVRTARFVSARASSRALPELNWVSIRMISRGKYIPDVRRLNLRVMRTGLVAVAVGIALVVSSLLSNPQ